MSVSGNNITCFFILPFPKIHFSCYLITEFWTKIIKLKFPDDARYRNIELCFDIFSPIRIDLSHLTLLDTDVLEETSMEMLINSFLLRASKIFGLNIFTLNSSYKPPCKSIVDLKTPPLITKASLQPMWFICLNHF